MLKKIVLLLCVLALCGNVQAATVIFTDADPADHLWGTPGNWDPCGVPLAADNPHIGGGEPGVIIPSGYTAVGNHMFVAVGEWADCNVGLITIEAGGYLSLTGGLNLACGGQPSEATVTNSGDIAANLGIMVAYQSSGDIATFNMLDGTMTTNGHIVVGRVSGSTGTFNMDGGAVDTGVSSMFVLGNPGGTGTLNMTGGTVTTWMFQPGYRGTGTVNMSNGTIIATYATRIGEGGTGTFNMTGGTLDTAELNIGTYPGGTGHLQLDGGTITATSFEMRAYLGDPGGVGTMDINGDGKLIIDGDVTTLVQGYIDSGWITTAYGGIGTVLCDYNVTTPLKTTVYAPISPTLVAPAPCGVEDVNLSPTLEWIPADVSGRTAQYLNYYYDPNSVTSVTLGADVNSYTIGPLAGLTTYYWSVDTDFDGNTLPGPYWNFTTVGVEPEITVYDNVITATGLLPAIMSATVTDADGDLVSAAFSATDPNVTLQNEDVSNPYAPTVEVLTAQEGIYDVNLTVIDAEANVTVDTAQVSVYDDACEAAQAAPSWAGFNVYDTNHDCKVDLTDFAGFASTWLDDIKLQAQETY